MFFILSFSKKTKSNRLTTKSKGGYLNLSSLQLHADGTLFARTVLVVK